MYSRSQKNIDISVPFHSAYTETNGCPMHRKTETEQDETQQRKVWPTIPIVASSNKTLEESKQAERSIVLAERSHQKAIGFDWQCKLDRW